MAINMINIFSEYPTYGHYFQKYDILMIFNMQYLTHVENLFIKSFQKYIYNMFPLYGLLYTSISVTTLSKFLSSDILA